MFLRSKKYMAKYFYLLRTKNKSKVVIIIKLQAKNISVAFKQQSVLNHCSFEFQSGEIVGLIAPNGTGKTPLLNALLGLQKIEHGTLTLIYPVLDFNTREQILQQLEEVIPFFIIQFS